MKGLYVFRVIVCGFPGAAVPSLPHGAVVELPHPSEPRFLDVAIDHLLSDDIKAAAKEAERAEDWLARALTVAR